MNISHPKIANQDQRGEIIDIITNENIEYVTLITSSKGSTRGNHYHKETIQTVFILEGKMKLLSQFPDQPVVTSILEKGDLAVTYPNELHTMVALEDSSFMVFTRGPRGGENYENDTYRVPPMEG